MASNTKVGYYWYASDAEGCFSHDACFDASYLYITACAMGGTGNFGNIYRVSRTDLSCGMLANVSGATLGLQDICLSGNYLYVTAFAWTGVEIFSTQYATLTRLDKTTMSYVDKIRVSWGGSVQGVCAGKDANNADCVYMVGQFALDGTVRLAKFYTDLTYDSGHSVIEGHANGLFMYMLHDSADNSIYMAGKNRNTYASIAKIIQTTTNSTAIMEWGSEVEIRTAQTVNDAKDTWLFKVVNDPDDSNIIWAAGLCPKSAGDHGAILLVKCQKDYNDTGALRVDNVYRIENLSEAYCKGASVQVTSTKIFVGTFALPHSLLGDDDYDNNHRATTICINKSDMTVRWARRIETGAGGGQHSYIGAIVPADGNANSTNVFMIGAGDAKGNSGRWSIFCALYDSSANDLGTSVFYSADASIKETSQLGNFTCIDITAGSSISYPANTATTWGSDPEAETKLTWSTSASLTSTVITLDSTVLYQVLKPNGNGSLIQWAGPTTAADHYLQLINAGEPDDAATQLLTGTPASWRIDLFTYEDVPAGVERITKMEMFNRARWQGTTSSTRLQPAWKYSTAASVTWAEDVYNVGRTSWVDMPLYEIPLPSTYSDWTHDRVNGIELGVRGQGNGVVIAMQVTQQYIRLTWEPYKAYNPDSLAKVNFRASDNSYMYSMTYDVAPTSISATASVTVPTLAQVYVSAPANVTATEAITVPTLAQVYVSTPANVSASRTITVPTISQVVTLTPPNLSFTITVTAPTLSQLHMAAPANISATAAVTVPTLIHNYAFTPASLTATEAITVPTLAQVHSISPANYQARAEISEIIASTLYTISGTNISARAAVNEPVITQIYNLIPDNISRASAVSAAALLSEGTIAAVSVGATAAVTVPTLAQVHAIVPADIGITAVLSSVAASSEGQMTPISIVAYESITEPVLTQLHLATPADVTATDTITPPVLTQVYTIAGADISALAVLSGAILTDNASAVLSPVNIILYPSISVPLLSQAHAVSVSNVSATKAITAVNVSETGGYVLSIAAVTGTATLSAATLSQIYSIQAANVAAGGQASVAVLTQDHIIAAADISASATVDALNIVYGQFLTIDNVVATAGVTSATLVIDAWEQTLVIDGITRQAALSIASVLQTHTITPADIMCNAVMGTAGIGTFGKIYKPQIKSLSYKRLTIESK